MKRHLTVLITILTLSLGNFYLKTGMPKAQSGPIINGKITFSSFRDGNPEIYVLNADGSNQVRLTTTPNGDV